MKALKGAIPVPGPTMIKGLSAGTEGKAPGLCQIATSDPISKLANQLEQTPFMCLLLRVL